MELCMNENKHHPQRMSSQIQKVLKQALITFTCKPEAFAAQLHQLSTVLDKLTSEDVKFDIKKHNDIEACGDGAPVTYIDIYEDPVVTLGIFVLKNNKKLPLHNHPEMHGLIKVLCGKIKVISYSLNTPKTIEADKIGFKEENLPPRTPLRIPPKRLTAELTSTDILSNSDKPCLLEPSKRNIHEIHSIEGPAAFLDILAPPYMTEIPNAGPRYCSYYSISSNVMPNVFRLQETRNPSWYWTDSAPYLGPDPTLQLEVENEHSSIS